MQPNTKKNGSVLVESWKCKKKTVEDEEEASPQHRFQFPANHPPTNTNVDSVKALLEKRCEKITFDPCDSLIKHLRFTSDWKCFAQQRSGASASFKESNVDEITGLFQSDGLVWCD